MFKFLTAFTCLLVILLLSTSPGFTSDSDTLLRIGLEKSNSGDYCGALIEFSRAIEVEPNNASAFHYRGVAKSRFGDFEASIIDYNEAIELDSSRSEFFGSRGIAKARSGDLPGAILDFDCALEMNPNDGVVYFNHGMAMEMSHNIHDACLDWAQADALGELNAKRFIRKYCQ